MFADIAVQGRVHPFSTNFITPHREILRNEDAIREFLRTWLPPALSWGPDEKQKRRKRYQQGLRPQEYSPLVDRLARFIVAFLGGACLIVPMLIMSLRYSRTKSLVTTSVAVVLFALTVSAGFRINNTDTIMVVFVGASGPGT
jgi:uncharacterized membrane protein YfcA